MPLFPENKGAHYEVGILSPESGPILRYIVILKHFQRVFDAYKKAMVTKKNISFFYIFVMHQSWQQSVLRASDKGEGFEGVGRCWLKWQR